MHRPQRQRATNTASHDWRTIISIASFLLALTLDVVSCFVVPQLHPTGITLERCSIVPRHPAGTVLSARRKKKNTNITGGGGAAQKVPQEEEPSWLERSDGVDEDDIAKEENGAADVEVYYDVGLSGSSWQTGRQSGRLYDTMVQNAAPHLQPALPRLALELTAQQAVEAALKQNGLQLANSDDDSSNNNNPLLQQGTPWYEKVESIRVHDDTDTDNMVTITYDSWDEAVMQWKPGQDFDFVARRVPAKSRELTVEELLEALDPDGSLRQQGEEAQLDLLPVSDECESLAEMARENIRRTEATPHEAVANEADAFSGVPGQRGYRVLAASELSKLDDNNDDLLDSNLVMHVMNALVAHGCLIVDVTNGGTDFKAAKLLADMWTTTEQFFTRADIVDKDNKSQVLPPLATATETGSPHAKVGYVSYDNGNMQFLETRLSRTDQQVLPIQTAESSLLGPDSCRTLQQVLAALSDIGKGVVRVAVTASALEMADCVPGAVPADFDAVAAATRVAEELLDDGQPLSSMADSSSIPKLLVESKSEAPVSMSPHRLCRYSNQDPEEQVDESAGNGDDSSEGLLSATSREIFGAHTDSSFVTIVPVAAVSGLEVYDESTEEWYRPELAAKRHYDELMAKQQQEDGNNDDDNTTSSRIPWHARYVVVMPGELLQILTRQEVLAAVHRVVATRNGASRYSAPVLLRGRSGTVLQAERYWGKASTPLLRECDGKTMQEIHSAMQPTPAAPSSSSQQQ